MTTLENIRLRADIVVTSQEGEPRLLVETKTSRFDTSKVVIDAPERVIPPECYFLLITPQAFWLVPPQAQNATYEGQTEALLERYIDTKKLPLITLGDAEFASVVASWLGSIIFKPAEVLLTMPAQRWLVETGLHHEIVRGYIKREGIYN